MLKLNVTETRKLNLCLSCESCLAVCPEGAVTMEFKFGQFLPKVDEKKCTRCGLCLQLCPGIDFDPFAPEYNDISEAVFDGPCLQSYTACSNNARVRENSTSGGVVTALVTELIKDEEFDAAFVLPFDIFDGKPTRLTCTSEVKEVFNCAKSKYIPASVYNIVKALQESDGKKYIVIGTGCQIFGIKKFLRQNGMSENNLLFLGLFCDRTLNFHMIRYFAERYGKPSEMLVKLEYRTKEVCGWPGDCKLYFDSGRELIVDRAVRTGLKRYFQLERCLFCVDKLNQFADIALGDCYIAGKSDIKGKSSVIVRTEKGQNIFNKYSFLFILEEESVAVIRKSQYLEGKKDNLEYARAFVAQRKLYHDTAGYNVDTKAVKAFSRLERFIRWGRNYNIRRIRYSLLLSRIWGRVKEQTRRGIAMITLVVTFTRDLFGTFVHNRRRYSASLDLSKHNILIVGGELLNKGAQAMTFTVVDQLKRRFPQKDIYLLSQFYLDSYDDKKGIYNFELATFNLRTKLELICSFNRVMNRGKRQEHPECRLKQILMNSMLVIDISGYALSSQFRPHGAFNYLLDIMVAKKYNIPYYIFPQSIGPFNFPLLYKIVLFPLMWLYLRYPAKIYIREEAGLDWVKKFTKYNVEVGKDIVLGHDDYCLANIYKSEPSFRNIKIEPNSIGVIPSMKIIEWGGRDCITSLYCPLIDKLLDKGKTVYVLRHSYKDLDICLEIKDLFSQNDRVKLISDDLNVFELEYIIAQFDFVIASRYHSIIHAYKKGVPVLAIGWAVKYFELMQNFEQLNYFLDVRDNLSFEKVFNRLENLVQTYVNEKQKIMDKIRSLNEEDVFYIFGAAAAQRFA